LGEAVEDELANDSDDSPLSDLSPMVETDTGGLVRRDKNYKTQIKKKGDRELLHLQVAIKRGCRYQNVYIRVLILMMLRYQPQKRAGVVDDVYQYQRRADTDDDIYRYQKRADIDDEAELLVLSMLC
jgi:hypothetical protein